MGVAIFLSHICGEQNRNLPFWSQLSYGKRGMVSVGREVSLSAAGAAFPQNVIMGNVDPVTIQEGTPEEVLELCKACIAEGKDHPGRLCPHVRLRGASAGAAGERVPDGQGVPRVRPVLREPRRRDLRSPRAP